MPTPLLVGDIGGTKTLLALISANGRATTIVRESMFMSREHDGVGEMVSAFLAGCDQPVHRASFSVAGIVGSEGASLPNLGWTIDAASLRRDFGLISLRLLNDVQAMAYALPHLTSEDVTTLQAGRPDPRGARAVIAPGTGLGEGLLLRTGAGFRAFPTEAGRADFAPTDQVQLGLLAHLLEFREHVSYEDVCSGLGIPAIYRYLEQVSPAEDAPAFARDVAASVDPTPMIVEAGMTHAAECPIAASTLRVFASILAAEAGNLALRSLATGGIYLSGGLPPRILPLLRSPWFLEAFRRKGAFSGLIQTIPLHVITEPRSALIGAARYELEREANGAD